MEVHLLRSHAALPAELDRPVALAAAQAHGETGADAAAPSGGNLELLPDQSPPGCSGSDQWKHQSPIASWSRLSRSRLLAAEGAALGRYQDRIRRFSESRLKCALRQILVQSRKCGSLLAAGTLRSLGTREKDHGSYTLI